MPRIVLQAPREGISSSPHVGYADVRNLDIDSRQGVARLNNIMVKKSTTVVDAQVKWIVRDPDTPANIFALDSNGVLYKSADSGATWAEVSDRGGTGQGLMVQWGYVFVAEATTMDIMKISDSSWTDNWAGLTMDTDSLWHPMFVSSNDSKIYGGAGKYVFSIEQVGTFDPANAATYTATAQALDLPAGYRIKCLEELGNNLMCGTWKGSAVTDIEVADIFPWDRSSVSFGQPVRLGVFGVHAMKNDGNSLIVLAGVEGLVYSCNGASAWAIGQLPQDLSGGKYLEYYPGALVKYKNKIFFGVGQGGSTAIAGMGVYSLKQTGKGNILNLEHLNSSLTDGSYFATKSTALLPVTRDTLLASYTFSGVITMTIADPCVVTLASHGFVNGTGVRFTTTGALPTGITSGTYYFTRSTATNTFNLYDTAAHAITGGATGLVATTGAQNGVHTLSSYGIDLTTATSYAYDVDYSGYFDSPLYEVGNVSEKWKPTEIELHLGKPLATGEGIQVKYRKDLSDSWVAIKTMAYADNGVGAMISKIIVTDVDLTVKAGEQLQLRVALKGTATTTPAYKFLILK